MGLLDILVNNAGIDRLFAIGSLRNPVCDAIRGRSTANAVCRRRCGQQCRSRGQTMEGLDGPRSPRRRLWSTRLAYPSRCLFCGGSNAACRSCLVGIGSERSVCGGVGGLPGGLDPAGASLEQRPCLPSGDESRRLHASTSNDSANRGGCSQTQYTLPGMIRGADEPTTCLAIEAPDACILVNNARRRLELVRFDSALYCAPTSGSRR